MPLRIGLTGGIGSGKTTVADHFNALGVDILDADVIVHGLSQPGQSTYDDIVQYFGSQVLNEDGSLNRDWLRDRVWQRYEALQRCRPDLHPYLPCNMPDEGPQGTPILLQFFLHPLHC